MPYLTKHISTSVMANTQQKNQKELSGMFDQMPKFLRFGPWSPTAHIFLLVMVVGMIHYWPIAMEVQRQRTMARSPQPFLSTLERIGVNLDHPLNLRRIVNLCGECDDIAKIDHITFVCAPSERDAFLQRWEAKGFSHHGTWQTNRYPADHIALISGKSEGYPWTDMIGLSVQHSDRDNRPLNESVRTLEQDQIQHIAFNVKAEADIEALYQRMTDSWGLDLMTPILRYTDDHGAGLRQWFTTPVHGLFIEFVQRIPNSQGEPYSGFDPDIIDDLYQSLDGQLAHLH